MATAAVEGSTAARATQPIAKGDIIFLVVRSIRKSVGAKVQSVSNEESTEKKKEGATIAWKQPPRDAIHMQA